MEDKEQCLWSESVACQSLLFHYSHILSRGILPVTDDDCMVKKNHGSPKDQGADADCMIG